MRVYSNSFSSSGSVPEYKYINYDLEVIRQEYDRISNTIMEMQIALDRYNQTVLFDGGYLSKNFRTGYIFNKAYRRLVMVQCHRLLVICYQVMCSCS